MAKKNARAVACTQLDLESRRLKSGLSLEQIAESTKISIRFLKAIEDEDFGQLPGGIFNTSYLKQYANATNFDVQKLLSVYERQTEPSQSDEIMLRQNGRGLLRWFRVPAATR